MSQENQFPFKGSTLAATAAGIGLCFVAVKYRSPIIKQIKVMANYTDPLRNQKVRVIDTVDECRTLMRNMKMHCNEYNVLGFDCEWVSFAGTRRPVSMLQLTSHRGLCALIRLSHLQMIPSELKEILEDDNILKVGVGPQGDATYLAQDYGVCVASTLDLRYLAEMTECYPGGLGKMSEKYLKVKLNKDWRIRCSDWEAPILNEKQIDYAAKDAHVGIELFKFFIAKLERRRVFEKQSTYLQRIIDEYCFRYLDIGFGKKAVSKNSQEPEKKSLNSVSLYNLKIMKSGIRQKPLYTNCLLEANDGELLCTIDQRKAMWYVNKDLGEIVSETPLTVRLKFEPAGRAVGQTGKYYKLAKENKCVACGEDKNYVRKNVVPRDYRKYFPLVMKGHTSHDVVLLCPRCHQISNIHDEKLREKLAEHCNAPIIPKTLEIPRLKELKSICRALYLQRNKIPEERQHELRARLQKLCPEEENFSDEFFKSYVDIDAYEMNDNYSAHGAKVVEFYQNSDAGLIGLERIWREHFLKTMKPEFLPDLWSIEHNAERLKIRADEGRIDENDMKLAGLPLLSANN
ncbi:exonuclease 3'-5' domain-containing protein 2 [Contarinia nasturtii]|uniref:exonuclease 3'-5' domain-containing protein 2 n=1 Tax=Contarinia nasturtii TaxID=265458 RepID=UPI0012D3EF70|nr:exonuclease 3'-5' domain-containing protein 2 [Contarinia nasturtii]